MLDKINKTEGRRKTKLQGYIFFLLLNLHRGKGNGKVTKSDGKSDKAKNIAE